jgi:hypothetical protein
LVGFDDTQQHTTARQQHATTLMIGIQQQMSEKKKKIGGGKQSLSARNRKNASLKKTGCVCDHLKCVDHAFLSILENMEHFGRSRGDGWYLLTFPVSRLQGCNLISSYQEAPGILAWSSLVKGEGLV